MLRDTRFTVDKQIEAASQAALPQGASARLNPPTPIEVDKGLPCRNPGGRPRAEDGGDAADRLALRDFDDLPASAFVSVRVVARLLSLSTSAVWMWVRKGWLPAPTKLSPQSTRWSVAAVREARAKFIEMDRGGEGR